MTLQRNCPTARHSTLPQAWPWSLQPKRCNLSSSPSYSVSQSNNFDRQEVNRLASYAWVSNMCLACEQLGSLSPSIFAVCYCFHWAMKCSARYSGPAPPQPRPPPNNLPYPPPPTPSSPKAKQEAYWQVSDGVRVPLEIARLFEPLHDWGVLDVLVNHSTMKHGMERRHRGQEEVRRVFGPPRPPHQGHCAVIKMGGTDIIWVCCGVASEQRFSIHLLGALCAMT